MSDIIDDDTLDAALDLAEAAEITRKDVTVELLGREAHRRYLESKADDEREPIDYPNQDETMWGDR